MLHLQSDRFCFVWSTHQAKVLTMATRAAFVYFMPVKHQLCQKRDFCFRCENLRWSQNFFSTNRRLSFSSVRNYVFICSNCITVAVTEAVYILYKHEQAVSGVCVCLKLRLYY